MKWTSNPGKNTYRRYGGSNSESSERIRRPNGEVRGSNLIGAETGSVSHVVRWDISKENVQNRINLGVAKELNRGEVPPRVMKCFSCGDRGHISTRCPARPNQYCLSNSRAQGLVRDGKIEGEGYQEDGKIYRKGTKGGGRESVEQ